MVLDKRCPVDATDWQTLIEFLGAGDGATAFFGGRNRYHCSYVVYTDGTYVYAENGETGELDFGGSTNEGGANGTSFQEVVQAASDALISGGLICVRAGSYNQAAQITLTNDDVKVVGEGESTIITRTADVISFQIEADDVEVSNMKINGGGFESHGIYGTAPGPHLRPVISGLYMENFGTTASAMIYPRYTSQGFVVNNYLTGGYRGIRLIDATVTAVAGNYITLTDVAAIVTAENTEACLFVGNKIYNCGTGMSFSAGGFGKHRVIGNWVDTTTVGNGIMNAQDEVQVIGNNVTNTTGVSIGVGGYRSLIKGNYVADGTVSGITTESDGPNIIEGNHVYQCGRNGIYAANVVDVTIINNVVIENSQESGDTYDGIYTGANVERAIIMGNKALDEQGAPTQRYGIRIDDGDDHVIIGNTCEGNTRYGIHLVAATVNNALVSNNMLRNNTLGTILDAGTNTMIFNNEDYNPQAASTPAVGGSPVTFGPYAYPVYLEVSGGNVTNVTVRGQVSGLTAGGWMLYPGDTCVIVYVVAPTVTLWPQ